MHTFWAVSQVGRALRAMKNLLLVSYVELRPLMTEYFLLFQTVP